MFTDFNDYIQQYAKYINGYTGPLLYIPNNSKHLHFSLREWVNLLTLIEEKSSIERIVISVELFTQLEKKFPVVLGKQTTKLISVEQGLLYAITQPDYDFDFNFIFALLDRSPLDLNQFLPGLGDILPLHYVVQQHSQVSYVQVCSLVKALIKKGARVLEPNFQGYQTALSEAWQKIKEDTKKSQTEGGKLSTLFSPPPRLASEKLALLDILIERLAFLAEDQLERQLNICVHFLKEHGSQIDDSLLDHCVSRLTGVDIASVINNSVQKAIYTGHLLDIKGTKQTSPGVDTELEAWRQDLFLPHKIRNLFELLARLDSGAIFLHEIFKYNVKTPLYKLQKYHQDISAALKKEILCCLTTFHVRAIFEMIKEIKNQDDRTILGQSLATFLHNHLTSLPEKGEFCFPVSWRYNNLSGHTIYVNFIRKSDGWLIFIDNLGEGSDQTHPDGSQQQDLHERKGISLKGFSLYYPCVLEVQTDQADAVNFIRLYLERLITINIKKLSSLQECIRHVYPFDLLGKECINIIDERDRLIFPEEIQTVGNCVVRNHQPGEKRRLMLHLPSDATSIGQIYDSLIDQELALLKRKPYQLKGRANDQDWVKHEKEFPPINYTLAELYNISPAVFSRLVLMGPTITLQRKLEAFGLIFNDDQRIQDFLVSENQRMIYQVAHDVVLESMRVYQTLQNLPGYTRNDSTVFIRLKTALASRDLLHSASLNESKLLVLICDSDLTQGVVQFIQTLANQPQQKIIFITTTSQNLSECISSHIPCETIEVENGFTALTQNSQVIIQSHKVNFQGTEIPLSKLIHDPVKLLNAKILSEIVAGEAIRIGEALDSFEAESYYIDRTFCSVQITDNALQNNKNDIFVISGMTQDEINTLLPIEGNQAQYIILKPQDDPLVEFQRLCKANPNSPVHLLKRENKAFIWQRSQGSVANLRQYTQAIPAQSLPEGQVIISAEPGMGKSTILDYLAHRYKADNPALWVIKINLRNVENQLKKIDFKDLDSVIDFFIKDTNLLAEDLFRSQINRDNNGITIFLDGFDEIQAAQQDRVIELLQILKMTKVKSVVVATRPHLQQRLEEALNLLAYGLVPFDEEDVYRFLANFWQKELKLDLINLEKGRHYIRELMAAFTSSTTDEQREFIGIPLQAKLLGVAFLEGFKTFYLGNYKRPRFPERLALCELYQRFISVKYDLLLQEKYQNYNLPDYIKNLTIESLDRGHEHVAFKLLFPDIEGIANASMETDLIKAAGIVQFIQGEPQFIHRTFAEYFAAQFLIKGLSEPDQNQIHQRSKSFLLRHIFKVRNQVVCTFIDERVSVSSDTRLKKIWQEIEEHSLLPSSHHKIIIPPSQEDPSTQEDIQVDPLVLLKAMRNRWQNFVGKKKEIADDIDDFEMRAEGIDSRRLNDHTLLKYIKKFCRYILGVNDAISQIEETLTVIKEILTYLEPRLWQLLRTDFFDRKDVSEILKHYIKTCLNNGVLFKQDVINAFKKIYWPVPLVFGQSNRDPEHEQSFNLFDMLYSLMKAQQEITADFIEDLTEAKILYLLWTKTLVVNEILFTKLKVTYSVLRKDTSYQKLLMRCASGFTNELRCFLLEKKDGVLLCALYQELPQMALTIQEIDALFLAQSINLHKKKLFSWLREAGIRIVETFKILTPTMTGIFNSFSSDIDAKTFWYELYVPLLTKAGHFTDNFNVSHVDFLNISACAMEKFLLQGTPARAAIQISSRKDLGYLKLLKLTETTINNPEFDKKRFSICVRILTCLNEAGLILVDSGSSILVINPKEEIEYELKIERNSHLISSNKLFKCIRETVMSTRKANMLLNEPHLRLVKFWKKALELNSIDYEKMTSYVKGLFDAFKSSHTYLRRDRVLNYINEGFLHTALKYNKEASIYVDFLLRNRKAPTTKQPYNSSSTVSQIELLATAFLDPFRKYYLGNKMQPIFPENLTLSLIYQRFIEAKYNLFLQTQFLPEKSEESKLFFIEKLDEIHQLLVMSTLFPDLKIAENRILSTEEKGFIQSIGIITFNEGEPHFLYPAFAVYFAAQFLLNGLNELPQHPIHQRNKNFLIPEIFKTHNRTLFIFIGDLVRTVTNTRLKQTWEEIKNT